MDDQQSVAMELNDQQPLLAGRENQQTNMGIINDQTMAIVNPRTEGTETSHLASRMHNQLSITRRTKPAGATSKFRKQVPFAMLLPIIQPQLDKDRAMQLQILYTKLKKYEISKESFVRQMRKIVGDQMVKRAVYVLQTQAGDKIITFQSGKILMTTEQKDQHLSGPELQLHGSESLDLKEKDGSSNELNTLPFPHNPSIDIYPYLQDVQNNSPVYQPTPFSKQVAFKLLLPIIHPQLDKDRSLQLHTLYTKLKQAQISKDDFIRQLRSIVGDQMLKMAVYELQTQARNRISSLPSGQDVMIMEQNNRHLSGSELHGSESLEKNQS